MPPFVLVGHSLGGQVADAFAVQRSELVAGLVLLDSVDPELNLDIAPPSPVVDDAADHRSGTGWLWAVAASAREFRSSVPADCPPTVVVGSAIWRWFQAKQPERYRPLSLADVDQRWQRAQLDYARRWRAQLVVAHDAGHRIHEDAPGLVAAVIDAVVQSAGSREALRLDGGLLHDRGGSIRPTSRPQFS